MSNYTPLEHGHKCLPAWFPDHLLPTSLRCSAVIWLKDGTSVVLGPVDTVVQAKALRANWLIGNRKLVDAKIEDLYTDPNLFRKSQITKKRGRPTTRNSPSTAPS